MRGNVHRAPRLALASYDLHARRLHEGAGRKTACRCMVRRPFALAMLLRSVGTVVSSRYFEVLGIAALLWLVAALIWALYRAGNVARAARERNPAEP